MSDTGKIRNPEWITGNKMANDKQQNGEEQQNSEKEKKKDPELGLKIIVSMTLIGYAMLCFSALCFVIHIRQYEGYDRVDLVYDECKNCQMKTIVTSDGNKVRTEEVEVCDCKVSYNYNGKIQSMLLPEVRTDRRPHSKYISISNPNDTKNENNIPAHLGIVFITMAVSVFFVRRQFKKAIQED